MNYKKLTIHPFGELEVITPIIGEVVHKHGGLFNPRKKLGMPMYEATFENTDAAIACLKELEEMDEVSLVKPIENA